MKFKTAVWQDPQTEQFYARIFTEAEGIDLAAWGMTGDVQPIDLNASSLFGPNGLGQMIDAELEKIAPDYPSEKMPLIWLAHQTPGADIRAELESKLAAVAA